MKLTKVEQETIINFNEEEQEAEVYTHNSRLIGKLKRLSEKYPALIYPTRPEHPGAVSYIVPKNCISVREPYNPERRKAQSEHAKAAGFMPPSRKTSNQ